MGNTSYHPSSETNISNTPIISEPISRYYSDKFFKEYKFQTVTNTTLSNEYAQKWESGDKIIFDLSLEKQAEYADYVVNHICELDLDIVKDFVLYQKMTEIQLNDPRIYSSSFIGGKAKVALTLQDKFPDIADQLEDCIVTIKKLRSIG
jgi:hypothetical protein